MAEQLSRLGQGAIIVSKDKYVGIGTINPEARLQIDSGSGIGTIDAGYSLSIRGDGIDGIQILSDSAYQGRIIFGDQNNKTSGRIDYDHSTDAFRLYTNGTEKVSILSGGNVGIGTDNPTYKLTVDSPNTIAPFALRNSSNSNRRYLAVTSQSNNPNLTLFNSSETSTIELNTNGDSFLNGGNVGIGTNNPDRKLHVYGSGYANSSIIIQRTDAGSNNDGSLLFVANSTASSDVGLGGIWFQNTVNNNFNALIRARTDNSAGTSGRIEFVTGIGVANSTDPSMVVKGDGNVGIGTVTPQAKLEVTATTHVSSVPTMQIYHRDYPATGDVNVPALNVNVGIANSELYRHGYVVLENHFTGGSYDSPNLFFKTNKNGSNHREWWGVQAKANSRLSFSYSSDDTGTGAASASPNEVMSFSTNGNVGIGTSSPRGALEVYEYSDSTLRTSRYTSNGIKLRAADANDSRIRLAFDAYLYDFTDGQGNTNLYIAPGGQVGIGTTNPSEKLHLYASLSGAPNFVLQSNAAAGQEGGGILFKNTANYYDLASIKVETNTYTNRGDLVFATANTSTPIEAIRILGVNQNVGIGTTDPTARLDVKSNIIVRDTDSDLEHIQLWSNGTEGVLRLRNGANWGFIARGISNSPYIGAYSGGSLHVVGFTNATGSTYNSPTMSFDFNNDRVGIGSGVPSSKLDVHLTNQSAYSTSSTSTDHLQIRTQQNTGTSGAYSSLRMLASSNNGTNNAVGIINLVSPTNGNNDSAFTFQLRNSSGVYGEKVRIQADGKIQIGNNIPMWSGAYGGALVLKGDNATSNRYAQLAIVDSTGSIANNGLILNNDGNVGIGVTDPGTTKLRVVNGSSGQEIFKADDGATAVIRAKVDGTVSFEKGITLAGRASALNTGSKLQVDNAIALGSSLYTFSQIVGGADLQLISNANPANIGVNSNIIFKLGSSGGGGPNEKMRIVSDGNVGIGVTDPDGARLVIGEGPGANNLRLLGRAADGWAFLQFRDSSNTTNYGEIGARSTELRFYQGGTQYQTVTNGGDIKFNTYGLGNNTGTSAYYLTVDSSGNVIEELISSGTPTGSGTTNYIPKWTGAVALGNSTLYETSAGYVGIGTTDPNDLLHIQDSNTGRTGIAIDNTSTNGRTYILGSTGSVGSGANPGSFIIRDGDASSNRFVINSSGQVGIGTTSPGHKLDITGGAIRIAASGETKILFRETIATDTYADRWTIGNDDAINNAFVFSTGANFANPKLVILDSDNVGIGATNPSAKLDVRGSAVIGRTYDIGSYNTTHFDLIITNSGSGSSMLLYDDASAYHSALIKYSNATLSLGLNNANSANSILTTTAVNVTSTGVGIGTTSPSFKLHVIGGGARISDGETSLSPDSTSSSGTSSRALTILNLEDTAWTTDALTAYNNTTGYDISNRASYSFFARPKATNILTHCTEINDNAHLYRFVNLNSAATEPLLRWQFYQYDGSGTTGADFKVASKLFEINHAGGTQLMIKGNGYVGIGTSDPTNPLDVLGKVSINTDGTLNWGNAKDYGRLTWDTGKAVVRGESGKALSLGANGTQDYIWIATDGKVGIGTTAPTSTLEVSGTDTVFTVNGTNGTLFSIEDDLSDSLMSINDAAGLPVFEAFADSHIVAGRYNQNDFYIASGGNVGIGTSNPTGQIEVYKSNSQSLGGHIVLNNNGLNTLNETAIIFGDGASIYRRGAISCVTESSPYNGSLRFKTGLSAYSSLATRMTIDGTGKVGIGTTSPTYELEVSTSSNSRITATSVTNSVVNHLQADSSGAYVGPLSNHNLFIKTNNTTRVTVDTSGNVGIGTTDPSYKLDINSPTGGGIRLNHSDTWPSLVLATRVSESAAQSLSAHSSIYTTTPWTSGEWPFNTANGEYGALVLQSRDNGNGGIIFRTGTGSGYSNRLVVRETGNVGIGITNPAQLLHTHKTSGNNAMYLTTDANTSGSSKTAIWFGHDYSSSADWAGIIFDADDKFRITNGSSSVGTDIVINSSNKVGIGVEDPNYKLDIAGSLHAKDGSSAFAFNEYSNGATIWLDGADGDFTGGDYFNISANNSAQLTFGFAGGTNMTLTSAGNLGIGITNPGSYKLYVNGDVNVDGEIVLSGDVEHKLRKLATSNITGVTTDVTELRGRQIDLYAFDDICLRAGTGDNIKMFAQSGSEKITVGANVIINNAGNNVDFWVEGDTDTALLYSDASTDRIGIGTSIPNEKFTVSGNISASGTVYGDASEFGAVMEAGLKTENISELPEGTVLVWSDGTLVPCSTDNDYKVMGISTTHSDSPIVLGAEPVLVTGSVNEGDYIITSDKQGHGRAISVDDYYAEPGKYFGRIIAQSLNNGEGDSYTIKAMIRKL